MARSDIPAGYKRCSGCREIFPKENDQQQSNFLGSRCRECNKKHSAEMYRKKRESRIAAGATTEFEEREIKLRGLLKQIGINVDFPLHYLDVVDFPKLNLKRCDCCDFSVPEQQLGEFQLCMLCAHYISACGECHAHRLQRPRVFFPELIGRPRPPPYRPVYVNPLPITDGPELDETDVDPEIAKRVELIEKYKKGLG